MADQTTLSSVKTQTAALMFNSYGILLFQGFPWATFSFEDGFGQSYVCIIPQHKDWHLFKQTSATEKRGNCNSGDTLL